MVHSGVASALSVSSTWQSFFFSVTEEINWHRCALNFQFKANKWDGWNCKHGTLPIKLLSLEYHICGWRGVVSSSMTLFHVYTFELFMQFCEYGWTTPAMMLFVSLDLRTYVALECFEPSQNELGPCWQHLGITSVPSNTHIS